jgi:Flp pilus assembly protein TadD/peroxiredoxin
MSGHKIKHNSFSRRTLLKGMGWAPALFIPSPLRGLSFPVFGGGAPAALPLSDFRVTPNYPTKSPLDDVFHQVIPGTDEYLTEKYAFEITALLTTWAEALQRSVPALDVLARFIDSSIEATELAGAQENRVRSGSGIEVLKRRFANESLSGRERFLGQMNNYLANLSRVEIAEFEITEIEELTASPLSVNIQVRYGIVGAAKNADREQRIGDWRMEWARPASSEWHVKKWNATEETVSRARGPTFVEVTSQAFAQVESYKSQMLRGADHWRTVLDAACGIDVYGNNGVAVGDFDNDGFDDIYVCQPSGLPNRLYRNRGNGGFDDVTENAGLNVLDATSCALFADFENKGVQDLLVVCESGPLLFLNQGNGKFSVKRDAFKFAHPPQGTFTHAAIADYDRDGRLDVYFCLYNYYLGLDQYHYPAPYFDARNGPPNFLFHNEGNAVFQDRTEAAGLNVDNDRYSFACAWGDANGDGLPDLYVANDFGRGNLYRNNGNGTFSSVAREAGTEDVGAGMSACWCDFDGDSKQDIYVANMWSAPGQRISAQKIFHPNEPEEIRSNYRRHARGNSLYQNQGDGTFRNVADQAGVEMGRWSWSSDAWDFDHDGYSDLYIANGYISGSVQPDLSSFFWRQVVAKSAQNSAPSPHYEGGWNAINELVRSDAAWNGVERNVFYLNNHDGSFSDVSGVVGLDFPDDSRAFALADLDHDGRLEVVLKNRNAPQLRVLRNNIEEMGNSIMFRLRGTASNRDAIGAAVTIEIDGHPQTKYLQAGSGFLSQHSKALHFGVGPSLGPLRASIRWPSGATQTFADLPINTRIQIEEGSEKFVATRYSDSRWSQTSSGESSLVEPLPLSVETWLIEPLRTPDFSLPDVGGKTWSLRSLQGSVVLLNFWATASPASVEQFRVLRQEHSRIAAAGLRVLAVNVDDPQNAEAVRSFVTKNAILFPVLLGTQDTAGIYNILYRYMFARHRDLPIPASFLVDQGGMIVKVYQDSIDINRVLRDLKSIPRSAEERIRKALPFPGKLYQSEFHRNDFTYGVAFFQRGYLEQATESFRQVIASRPDDAEAYYNLGTLYLRRNSLADAQSYLEQALKLHPNYPEAWNNLGMLAAQQGRGNQAIDNFKRSLSLRPNYAVALVNLGNVYRRQRSFDEAQKALSQALDIEPNDPDANYSLGMLYAQQEQIPHAEQYLQKAADLRPGYPDALNNLGVLFVREQRYPEAELKFKNCIQAAPKFDQAYLNLARLYVILNDKERAKEVLQALLREQPQHKMAQQALEMLN